MRGNGWGHRARPAAVRAPLGHGNAALAAGRGCLGTPGTRDHRDQHTAVGAFRSARYGVDGAEVVLPALGSRAVGIVDPFAGSCNALYAILQQLPGAKGIGFEVEPAVFDLTTQNIAHLGAPIELVNGNYKDLVRSRRHPGDHLIVVFLAPPWADALRPDTGLHLDRTKPPILEIVHDFEQVYGAQPVLYVTEVHEVNEPKALKAVEAAFDWSDLRIYDVNAPGLQHGILLGTRRWPR